MQPCYVKNSPVLWAYLSNRTTPPLSTTTLHSEICHITSLKDEINNQKSLDDNTGSDSSHQKRSISQSSFISDLTPTDDVSPFDSTIYINTDLIQYDSQELVADYDDRSEVMRELQLKTMISPTQDLRFKFH